MSDALLISTRKGLFTVKRAKAGQWDVAGAAFVGDRVSLAMADPRDGAWYAALDHGHFGVKLHRSTDGGETWPEITAPAYPPKPDDEPEVTASGQPVPWTVQLIWALSAGGDDEPGALWCGTLPGGVFRSEDRGDTWQLCEALWNHPSRKEWFGGGADLPGVHSICVDPRDSARVAVGVSCGGVWLTRDRGASWEVASRGMFAAFMPPERRDDPVIQDPHRIVQCRDQPDNFWCQHHNGIFRSTDGCASWQEVPDVKPSVFGFGVAVHPREPDTAWFVPAVNDQHRIPVGGSVVVTCTRDGGRTVDQLRQGLPQSHAYDLVLRHALDIDPAGERLAFGSTTGSAWVSEDQGDTWITISQHLPPIYAVTFVPGA